MVVTEAIAVLKAARELFSESPIFTVLFLLGLLGIVWLAKQGVLVVVARQKRQRRADIFDTYQKVKALDGLTEGDRASMLAELRDAGVGDPRSRSSSSTF